MILEKKYQHMKKHPAGKTLKLKTPSEVLSLAFLDKS